MIATAYLPSFSIKFVLPSELSLSGVVKASPNVE
ncbi:Hypothetical protein Bdt_1081 [Bdellovibrio bacteriovorus str. Tiberius]|uniref:Uncharacterized protein n=1 Tax=Bdellovibrio bacteriovorus str. Tiberius TaxID=1069642 RepID=K7YLW5_BDEBC|nr:Hypothetical protein Bdt_1081 [Bdellovibrio bacteriovorus str. Tiberius]